MEDDRATQARRMFTDGHLCSQSVLAAYCGMFGLDEVTALKISCGLGSGFARRQHICGAVTGAIMVAGLKCGRVQPEDHEALETTYAAARQIMDQFAGQHGSIICRELLGCDISTLEGRREAERQGVFATRCAQYVEDAARLAESVCELEG